MMRADELVESIEALRRGDIEDWVDENLIVPREEGGELFFSAMECARVRLICTLRYELDIEAETLPVVLSLLDQLYQTRQRLLSLTAAVAAQDKSVQASVLAAIMRGAASDE